MSKVTIATAPCSWGVWYADGTPSGTPWNVFLDQAAAAGYKALELGPDGYLPTDENVLRDELTRRGLDVCSGTCCYQFDRYASFDDFRAPVEALCKRLNAFGAKYLVAMDESDVGKYSEKKAGFAPEIWNNFLEKIRRMGEFTKNEFGIEVVYHPHIRTMIETEAEIERLMDYTGLRLCFDTGHHAYVNGDGSRGETSAINFMKKYPDKIAYLHFKNVDYEIFRQVREQGLDSDTAFDRDVMCDLRDGIIDFNALRDTIDEIGFEGIGVIEQDMPRATTDQAFASARRNLDYLREIHLID